MSIFQVREYSTVITANQSELTNMIIANNRMRRGFQESLSQSELEQGFVNAGATAISLLFGRSVTPVTAAAIAFEVISNASNYEASLWASSIDSGTVAIEDCLEFLNNNSTYLSVEARFFCLEYEMFDGSISRFIASSDYDVLRVQTSTGWIVL